MIFCRVMIRKKVGVLDILEILSHFLASYQKSLLRIYHLKQELGNFFIFWSSSVQEDLSFRNTSQTSGQSSGGMEMESEDAEVTSATVPPASPTLDLNLDALDALRISGALEVTYLAGWQKN